MRAASACILMSTYNGERFLEAQLRSLLAQRDCNITVLVRDDGSTDGTPLMLERLAGLSPQVRVSLGSTVGITLSFFELLRQAPAGCDAYFFCDQDDVWHPDKVRAGVDALAGVKHEVPALYCCGQRYVDEQDRVLGYSRTPMRIGLSNALVQNIAIGCTVALNDSARISITGNLPKAAIMHDWWCYLVVSATGRVIYDSASRIDYRQHSENAVGASASYGRELVRRIRRRLVRSPYSITRAQQAAELLRLHGYQIGASDRFLVESFVFGKQSMLRRLRLVARGGVRRNSLPDQIVLCLQLAFNDY